MSGIAFYTPGGGVGSPEHPPLKPGGRQSDFIAGSTAAAATMFAIIARQKVGTGQHQDVSQHESIASFLRHQVPFYTYDPDGLAFVGLYDSKARTRRILPCRDGFVVNRCRDEQQWRALMGLVAGDGWEKEERFEGLLDGEFDLVAFLSETADTIRPVIAEWTAQRTTEEVNAAAQSRGIPIISPGGFFGFGYLVCKDGYVVNGCREEYQWRALIGLVAGDEWEKEERFKGLLGDPFDLGAFLIEAGPTIWPLVTKWSATRTRQEVTLAAQSKAIPIVPCNSTEDVFKSPHLGERQFLVEIDHPQTGKLRYPGAPYHLSETPWRVDRPAPLLGQHNEEILCERLGYSAEELASMRQSGTV
jgi:crotonobetainyl-CoA:carnitine CoA-transferase CaiB-like acyl-CoA transferase